MTDLDPLLFCNSRLRVTRHGDRGGGTSVVFVDPDEGFLYPWQFDVPDDMTDDLLSQIGRAETAWNAPAYVYGYAWGWATLDKRV